MGLVLPKKWGCFQTHWSLRYFDKFHIVFFYFLLVFIVILFVFIGYQFPKLIDKVVKRTDAVCFVFYSSCAEGFHLKKTNPPIFELQIWPLFRTYILFLFQGKFYHKCQSVLFKSLKYRKYKRKFFLYGM